MDETGVQSAGFLLELSLDWIVLRASENVDDFLGKSHVALIDEPLARFVQAQPLHDLRNLFSRLSGTTGIARAYRVRLTDDQRRFDIAFQLCGGRVLLEGMPSPERGIGQAIGTVGGLIEGLENSRGDALIEGAARRVRALTGYDRVIIIRGGRNVENNRGSFPSPAISCTLDNPPPIITDNGKPPVPVFPRKADDPSVNNALLRSLSTEQSRLLSDHGVVSALRVPIRLNGAEVGAICCESHTVRTPSLELHAALELFAQMFAMRLALDERP